MFNTPLLLNGIHFFKAKPRPNLGSFALLDHQILFFLLLLSTREPLESIIII
jgi:hypothetical protein